MTRPDHQARLDAVRRQLASAGVDGFVVPRADEHLGEYVPPNAERLTWLTGFTGSAGLAAILPGRAAVFTDGRYVLQLAAQTDPALFELRHLIDEPPAGWLQQHAAPGARIGYDPKLISADALARYVDAGLQMVPLAANPLDAAWSDRPQPPAAAAVPHPLGLAGFSSAEKRTALAADLAKARQEAAIITDPASVNWLLNIRGGDLAYTPFALGFAILRRDGTVQLFMDAQKLGPDTRAWLGNGVAVADPSALAPALAALGGQTVRVDRHTAPVWFAQTLEAAGATVVDGPTPARCRKPARTRPNRTAPATPMPATPSPCAASCTGSTPAATPAPPSRPPPTACWPSAARWTASARRASPPFPAPGPTAPSSTTASQPRDGPRARPRRGLPHRQRRPIPGRHHRRDPHRLDRPRRRRPPTSVDRFTRVLQGHIAIAAAVFPKGVAGPHLDALARHGAMAAPGWTTITAPAMAWVQLPLGP